MIKESFVFVADRLSIYQYPCARLLDIGCGNGDFLRYLGERFPHLLLWGIDTSPECVRQAKKSKAIIHEEPLSAKGSSLFDVITMIGVHSEFSDVKDWIPQLLRRGKKDATYFVMGYFNPSPIDVKTTWTYQGKTQSRGFNIVSKRTILQELNKRGYRGRFEEFLMHSGISKKKDPTRAWTFKDNYGTYLQTNGACQLLPFYLLTISKRSGR